MRFGFVVVPKGSPMAYGGLNDETRDWSVEDALAEGLCAAERLGLDSSQAEVMLVVDYEDGSDQVEFYKEPEIPEEVFQPET